MGVNSTNCLTASHFENKLISMRTLAIANQKGGVGKTATAHNLGSILAGDGLRVLLVDTDPQAGLTQACGVRDVSDHSLAEVLGGAIPGQLPMAEVIIDLGNGLSLAPADISLAATELGLNARLTGRETVLKKAIASVAGAYDLALIDCHPSLGWLTVNVLVAAEAVLIPTQAETVAMRGLRSFLDTIEAIRDEQNKTLEILGVVVTFYDGRFTHHRQAVETMRAAGLPILDVMIGRSVRVAEAAGAGQSVVDYKPGNPQAANYKQLADVVKRRLRLAGRESLT
jgi:chromosome partitioning protein